MIGEGGARRETFCNEISDNTFASTGSSNRKPRVENFVRTLADARELDSFRAAMRCAAKQVGATMRFQHISAGGNLESCASVPFLLVGASLLLPLIPGR